MAEKEEVRLPYDHHMGEVKRLRLHVLDLCHWENELVLDYAVLLVHRQCWIPRGYREDAVGMTCVPEQSESGVVGAD